MSDQAKQKFKLYNYDPSLAGNVVFIVLFSLATIGHGVLMIRHKTWYFIPFLIGCLFESIGYIGRAIQAQESPDWTTGPYIMQTLTILLGPTLYAASIYMVLGRLIRMLDAGQYSIVRPSWLTKIFVGGDVLSFLTQGAGGGILAKAKTKSDQDLGQNIVLAGLGIQVVFFGLFIITTIIFHVRIVRNPTPRSYSVTTPWRQLIVVALYLASVLIIIRSLFRLIEYASGHDGVLMSSEVYLFVFDSVLMFLVAVVFLIYHPGRVLVGYKQVGGSSDDGTDIEGARGSSNHAMVPVYNESGRVVVDPSKVDRGDRRERRQAERDARGGRY
ncbi:RTA1 like protein-domain-containing protein [Apodospora peruviana]|uniref:RTA1 like protein-domain-containing protein n=1 Tax=Apodospora peruviana TaxID=516989 RepID=A0AAE0M2T9_9PEZI|nr:RTA1 like protein-domain-containing protein [Apodospora peruviana]